jgi:hypothetical protein
MKNWNKICGAVAFFMLCFVCAPAQQRTSLLLLTPQIKPVNQALISVSAPVKPRMSTFYNIIPAVGFITEPASQKIHAILAPNHYTQNFGFFCKQELKIQKITKIPLFFRLGSLEYCNQLEGK